MVLDGRLAVKRQAKPTPETPKEPPGNGLCVREGWMDSVEGVLQSRVCVWMSVTRSDGRERK